MSTRWYVLMMECQLGFGEAPFTRNTESGVCRVTMVK